MIIDSAVSTRVFFAPLSTGAEKALSRMKPHWNAVFVTSMCTNMADSSSTIALATQRPGWRTGIALTSAPLRSAGPASVGMVTPGSGRRVDLRVADAHRRRRTTGAGSTCRCRS